MTKIVIYGPPQRWMRPEQGRRGRFGKAIRFTNKKVDARKRELAEALAQAHSGPVWTGPVALKFLAVFAIPESWPKKTKAAAIEGRVPHIADPDLDQLIKLAKDAASGIVYADDNQVAAYINPAKRYGSPERTEIEFIPIRQDQDAITPGQRRVVKRQRAKAMTG
jgi:Holliday junction resolvase RusA-like endonuclease